MDLHMFFNRGDIMNKPIFNGKFKAVTFSFDDGNLDDKPLVEIMNKYGIKGTFNLNSGLLTENAPWNFKGIKQIKHINYCDYNNLYEGHEIAAHSYTHPDLTKLSHNDIVNQIVLDKKLLEFLYKNQIEGFAYPMGTFNEEVGDVLKENGFLYGRTTKPTYNFELPQNPIFWHPTCHFLDKKVEQLTEKFVNSKEETALLYIWGHSYELVTDEDYERFHNLCRLLSGRDDVAYLTNIQVVKCINQK